jgi:penicillin-binding protein 1A
MPVNKLKENVTALKLEDVYTKEEIITLYLNTVSFGENVFGIKAASQRYFSRLPAELLVSEAAVLIGMLKANTSYNPRLYPEASMQRRNTVLALMVKEGFLEADEFNKLTEIPIALRYRKLDGREAPARYFHRFAEMEVLEILEEIGSGHDLYRDGLVIKTTLNATLQSHAENAVHDQMKKLQIAFDKHWTGRYPWGSDQDFLWKNARRSRRYKRMESRGASGDEIRAAFMTKTTLLRYTPHGMEQVEMTPLDSVAYHQMILQAGFTALDPLTGELLAYVGGIDFNHFPYDHVRSARQSGSTFKPFVYAAAIDAGFSPCDYIENERIIFSGYDDWSPENAGGEYGGYYSVRGGLANSVNTVAARLIAETGPEAVISMARSAGITSDLPKGPAISLGVADISLMELTSAYAVFANGGRRIEPVFIRSIATAEGEVIYEAPHLEPVQTIDRETALTTMYMMQAVVDSGTARSIRSLYGVRMPLAGKTGTTQNNADGWFIAASPGIVCGAWVGGESPLVRFRSTSLGQGARTALPIVGSFLRNAETDNATAALFRKNFPEVSAQIRLDSYCPMYRDKMGMRLFESLFDGEAREEKRELRQEAREEQRRKRREPDDEKNKDGWIRRLFDKLKKKD